jgi:hypothetical protein
MSLPLRLILSACFLTISSSLCMTAQAQQTCTPSVSPPHRTQTIDVIVKVGAYDEWLDSAPNSFGHQYDTLIVRVEKVVAGRVLDSWIRVDYWGSNRHHQEDRLPDAIFESAHRWEMRLTPMRVSEKNYQFCRPLGADAIAEVDESRKIIGEEDRYRSVSVELGTLPQVSDLKCYSLRRADVQKIDDPDKKPSPIIPQSPTHPPRSPSRLR